MRQYTCAQIATMAKNFELNCGDFIWVVPGNGVEENALHVPYVFEDGELYRYDNGESFMYEYGVKYTINEPDKRLKPYITDFVL